jgi:hypothetical protein
MCTFATTAPTTRPRSEIGDAKNSPGMPVALPIAYCRPL